MEESIKHIYELNSVVRMSLIEMQFIKKVSTSSLPGNAYFDRVAMILTEFLCVLSKGALECTCCHG